MSATPDSDLSLPATFYVVIVHLWLNIIIYSALSQ